MGRPLYSSTLITTPAVRDPDQPICETWSYLHPFDPDSDEFFDNEHAVYEDFIDAVQDEVDRQRDVMVVASPITSESSLSDEESSSPPGPVGSFRDLLDDTASEPAVARVRLASRAFAVRAAMRAAPPPRGVYFSDSSIPVPEPSAPIPVPAMSRRPPMFDERAFPSPSTPPRQTYVSMSPPPASTPRLYTWARNPHPASPSSGSPFTNSHARMSYTHLSPALIRIRDVTV